MYLNHNSHLCQVSWKMCKLRKTDPMRAVASYKNLLIFAGFYPNDDNKNDRFYYLRCSINWFISLLIFVPMVIEICLNLDNFSVISNTMYYSVTQASYLCKLINFTLNRKRLRILERILKSSTFSSHTTYENRFIENVITKTKIMAISFRCGIIALCVLYFLYPHLEVEDSLALPGWYPLNVTKYRNELITTQVLSVALSAHNNSTLDLFNYTLIMLGTAQLEILRERLRNVCDFEENADEPKTETIFIRVKGCIKQHQQIIEYVTVMDKTFSSGLFVQFVGTVIVVCLTGFRMVMVKPDSFQFLTLVAYLFCMLFQVSMYCYVGNDIMFESFRVGEAFYMSRWYESDTTVKKMIFTVMERVKKPVILTGGKFFNLTLSTLVLLLRSSYSYFAVLQRIYNKEQT